MKRQAYIKYLKKMFKSGDISLKEEIEQEKEKLKEYDEWAKQKGKEVSDLIQNVREKNKKEEE